MVVACIALSHAFKKKIMKTLLSNWQVTLFQCRFSSRFGLWTLANKQIAPRAHAALFEYMQFVRVLENITFCSLFTNRLKPFQSSYSNQQQPPLPLLIKDMRCSTKQSLTVNACNDFWSFSDSFKCFYTADMFVRYNLFGLFAYSAEQRKRFFAIFGLTISVAKHSVHPYYPHEWNLKSCSFLRCPFTSLNGLWW